MAVDWKVAFPLHPEYRTLPMVWYCPPLSPIQSAAEAGRSASTARFPDVESLRIPVRYLANMLTAGEEAPVVACPGTHAGHACLHARPARRRRRERTEVLERVGLDVDTVEDMYRYMAIADYEDRFVIPTNKREYADSIYDGTQRARRLRLHLRQRLRSYRWFGCRRVRRQAQHQAQVLPDPRREALAPDDLSR
jgi:nitrate reductase / nitrite oxidoreductase, beta subunit